MFAGATVDRNSNIGRFAPYIALFTAVVEDPVCSRVLRDIWIKTDHHTSHVSRTGLYPMPPSLPSFSQQFQQQPPPPEWSCGDCAMIVR